MNLTISKTLLSHRSQVKVALKEALLIPPLMLREITNWWLTVIEAVLSPTMITNRGEMTPTTKI